MRESRLRMWTILCFLATLACMAQSPLNGHADAAEGSKLLLYPREESCSWLLPTEEETKKNVFACFLPADSVQAAETSGEAEFAVSGEKHVLIYHTHTTEAYRMDGADAYVESGFSRTRNMEQNIVRVGEALRERLEEKGFRVIHDTTDHEPPKLATAYSRSEQTMQHYREKYPDMDLYIDLHRDAADVEKNKDDVAVIDGKRCARIMFVVGKGTKYEKKPDFDRNYALAEKLTAELASYDARLVRKIRVKEGRYNQHLADMSLLIEVGHNANTLQDALNSTAYLAEAIAKVIRVVD